MNKQSLFFTFLVALVATFLMFMIIQYLSKKWNFKHDKEGKVNLSYVIWLLSIIIPFFTLLKVALNQVESAIEIIIFSNSIENTFFEVMQKIAIFIGFTFIASFMSYYVVTSMMKLFYGNIKDSQEIENNNIGLFIIKLVLAFLLVFSLLNVFEHFLQWFAPVVDLPFYR